MNAYTHTYTPGAVKEDTVAAAAVEVAFLLLSVVVLVFVAAEVVILLLLLVVDAAADVVVEFRLALRGLVGCCSLIVLKSIGRSYRISAANIQLTPFKTMPKFNKISSLEIKLVCLEGYIYCSRYSLKALAYAIACGPQS